MGFTVDERFHPDLAEAVRRLVDCFQPERIYLFGSRARDNYRVDSDYDVLVVVPETELDYLERIRIGAQATRDLILPLQVVILTIDEFERDLRVVASLPARVAREGELLYAA